MSDKVIIFAQLGSPKSPKVSDVRAYIKEFLSNPLVVPFNPILWKIILNLLVLPFRAPKSAKRYQQIWDGKEFLLKRETAKFVAKIRKEGINAEVGYIIGEPSLKNILAKHQDKRRVVIPLFPQECMSTTGLVEEILGDEDVELIRSFHNQDFYIDSCVNRIENDFLEGDDLILSFHSVPLKNNGAYIAQCMDTFSLIKNRLKIDNVRLAFHSKFGKGEWVGPFLEELLGDQKDKKVAIFCPGFLIDCLETTIEIGEELKNEFPRIKYISCLNDSAYWVESVVKELGDLSPSSA